jgi:hypothetical protein
MTKTTQPDASTTMDSNYGEAVLHVNPSLQLTIDSLRMSNDQKKEVHGEPRTTSSRLGGHGAGSHPDAS